MPWTFIDKLADEILNVMDGAPDKVVWVTPDGLIVDIENVAENPLDCISVRYSPREGIYNFLKYRLGQIGVQSNQLTFGDVRATAARWEELFEEKRKITAHVCGYDPNVMDGFEKSIAEFRAALKPWDGDLDIKLAPTWPGDKN